MDADNVNEHKSVSIICALSDELNEDFVLPANVIEQFTSVNERDCNVVLRHSSNCQSNGSA